MEAELWTTWAPRVNPGAIIFGCDSAPSWQVSRSERSLTAAGFRDVHLMSADADLNDGDLPCLLLRAGAWLLAPEQFRPPPVSTTGRTVVAFGMPRLAAEKERWTALFARYGGDFDSCPEIPPVVSAWTADRSAAQPICLGLPLKPSTTWRLVHWPALDAGYDEQLRVIQIVTSLQSGGAERVAWDLHDVLPRQGVSSLIVTLGPRIAPTAASAIGASGSRGAG